MTLLPVNQDTAAAAGMLISASYLTTPLEVLDFMVTPGRWSTEVALWVAAGSPGQDSPGWALFAARLDVVEHGRSTR